MSSAAQIFLVVATGVIFLARFTAALYRARADGRAVETWQRRHAAERSTRGWPAE